MPGLLFICCHDRHHHCPEYDNSNTRGPIGGDTIHHQQHYHHPGACRRTQLAPSLASASSSAPSQHSPELIGTVRLSNMTASVYTAPLAAAAVSGGDGVVRPLPTPSANACVCVYVCICVTALLCERVQLG